MARDGMNWIDRVKQALFTVNLRWRILLLGLLIMVPVAGLEIHNATLSARQNLSDAKTRADILVSKADIQYDDILQQARTVLDLIANTPNFPSEGGAGCDQFMADIIGRYQWMTGIGVADTNGQSLCNSSGNHSVNLKDRDYFQKALATKTFTVSNFHIGTISHKPIIAAEMPILDKQGQVTRMLGTGISLGVFNSLLAKNELGSDVSVTIFDSGGTVIGRFPGGDEFIGKSFADHPLFKAIAETKKGSLDTLGLDGKKRIFAFQPFADIPAYIAVGIDEQPVLDRITGHLYDNLAILLGIILVSSLFGILATELMIMRPMRKLTTATDAIGQGRWNDLPEFESSMPEINTFLGAFRSMVERLHMREADLRTSEASATALNRNLLLGEQLANAGYWRIDYPDQKITWSNGVYRIHGVDPTSFITTFDNTIAVYHPEDRKTVIETIERAVLLQRDFEFTLRIVRPDGDIRHVLSRGFCEIGHNGEVSALFGAVVDVTVLKKTETRLTAARQAAENANRAKSDFLSSMSHELRTPLTSIIGFADLLLMRTRAAETKRYLQLQRNAGQHLLTLINDILDHSKIEAGKLELESVPFDLRLMIQSCHGVLEYEARRKNLAFETSIDPEIPATLIGDPNRLKQILLNLLGNAIKFTSTGSVSLEIAQTGRAGDVVSLRILVQDTGLGIAEEKRALLFQRFSQTDVSVTRQFGGTGLGLSISKSLVEAMGGSIGVDSVEGKGSTFWIALRLLSAPKYIEAEKKIVTASGRSSRILLAEDSPVNQILFQELLKTLGHQVVTVSDGAEAVEAVRDQSFDMVLMDMQMPVMDGLKATQNIRAFQNKTIPIIGLTANAMQEDIDRCLEAGMNGHLAKPVDVATLAEMIERMTGTLYNS